MIFEYEVICNAIKHSILRTYFCWMHPANSLKISLWHQIFTVLCSLLFVTFPGPSAKVFFNHSLEPNQRNFHRKFQLIIVSMAPFLVTFAYILCIALATNNCDSNCSSTIQWFNYPINNLDEPELQSLISMAARSLRDTGAFIIDPILSAEGLSILQQDMLSTHYNKQEIYRSVFQDQGDPTNFPDPNHSRNRVGFVRLGHTNRVDIQPSFEQIYAYPPLLSLLRAIVDKSGIYSDTIYLSTDEEGAIYSLIADPMDHGSWHYDQHPFSCVWMIHKPEMGGILQLTKLKPTWTDETEQDKEYWNLLQMIWDKDKSVQHYISTIEVDEGGMYCFNGNETLHQVTRVEGEKQRNVIVMAYATEEKFKHSDDILNINFMDGIVEVVEHKVEI